MNPTPNARLRHKQARLLKALDRVKTKLEYLRVKYHERMSIEPLTDSEEKEVETWNQLHELEDRLRERMDENSSKYYSEHWNQHGWNAYSTN